MEKKMTAALLQNLRPKLNAAVSDVAKEHGLDIRFGNATFDDTTATMKVEISFCATEDYDPAKENWNKYCGLHSGFAPEDFGKEFSFPGNPERYRISGYNQKAKTNRIIITRIRDSKVYVAASTEVLAAIGKLKVQQVPALIPSVANPGDSVDPAKREWDMNCWRWGMKPEDFGKETMVAGKLFKIVGCKPNARKNCILIRNVQTGTEYVTSAQEAKDGLKA